MASIHNGFQIPLSWGPRWPREVTKGVLTIVLPLDIILVASFSFWPPLLLAFTF